MEWEEEEVAGLCSCLHFIFSKVSTEDCFKRKSWPALVTDCVCKQRSMLVPIFISSSCTLFLPFLPSYLSALGLPIPAFALSCFFSPALSAFSYTQLPHPTHSLQNNSCGKSLLPTPCSDGRFILCSGGSPCPSHLHNHPLALKPSQTASFRLQSHLVFCFKHNQHCRAIQINPGK